MKRLLILVLLFSQVYAQKKVELPRRPGAASNTVYILDAPFKPGDTVLLSGDYLWIQIKGIKGTAEKPIVFKPKGKVTIGGYASYTLNLYGEHFKVLGGGKLVIGHPTVFAMGINLGTSHHVEIAGLEMYNVTTGIQQNPTGTELIEGCYYHDLYIHDMQNPPHKGRAEAFYIGKTSPGGCYFKDLRIENNRIENVSGDGIQVSGGTFTIRNNKVRNYGMSDLEQQNNGILVGGNATAIISGNEVSGGTGPALQVLGRG
ncbi:MAG: right-handed parallel beta-helix repeat-containing protein, partial [Flavitalea sp.]